MMRQLKEIDYGSLPISDYSREYIMRMLPHLDYYLDIYRGSLSQMLKQLGMPPSEVTMVDYGGGHGLLSLAAKRMGVGKVIYIDINPKAVETVTVLSQELGTAPDCILQGDASTLRQWSESNHTIPDALLGMDVIEHIYELESFFADIYAVNPRIFMLFTTGSTPYNPWVKRRLHRVMQSDEMGHGGRPGFFQLRKDFIVRHYPDMKDVDADVWAADTRGLIYQDILTAIDTHTPNPLNDPYNTCDPETGSWTERILPMDAYQKMVQPYGAGVTVRSGYYNVYRKGIKRRASRILNALIRTPFFRFMAPFIFIVVKK